MHPGIMRIPVCSNGEPHRFQRGDNYEIPETKFSTNLDTEHPGMKGM